MASSLDRSNSTVATITLAVGAALTAAPARSATALQLDGGDRLARVIGATDLVVATGLLRGRRRWPWMTLRAGLNAALARHYTAHARRLPALGMAALTVVDGSLAVLLRRRGR